MRHILVCAVLIAVSATVAAADDERPLVLQPSSPWVVDYKGESCALRRSFGGGDSKVWLEFDNFGLGESFRTTVAADDLDRRSSAPEIAFLPGGKPKADETAVRATFTHGRKGVIFEANVLSGLDLTDVMELPEAERETALQRLREEREKTVSSLSIDKAFERDLVLQTGRMIAPLATLRTCVGNVKTRLGLDPKALKTKSSSVVPKDMERWARKVQQVYPAQMIAQGLNAQLQVRLIVNAEGKVESCYVRPEGEPPVSVETACDILTREAVFEPALDATGNPISSIYLTRIVYSLR